MTQLSICFQCPRCHSFRSEIKNIRAEKMQSHPGIYFLNVDFSCCDCDMQFSQKFNVAVDETNAERIAFLTGKEAFPKHLCFCTKSDEACPLDIL